RAAQGQEPGAVELPVLARERPGPGRGARPIVGRHRKPEHVPPQRRRDRQDLGRRHPARRQAIPFPGPRHRRGHSSKGAVIMRRLPLLPVLTPSAPKPAPAPIPLLPGDGDTHVVKPPPPKPPAEPDPWTARSDLIPAPVPKAPAALELPKIEE